MKKNRLIFVIALFLTGIFMFSSCYTNKKGIVPCPQGNIDAKSGQLGDNKTEPV